MEKLLIVHLMSLALQAVEHAHSFIVTLGHLVK